MSVSPTAAAARIWRQHQTRQDQTDLPQRDSLSVVKDKRHEAYLRIAGLTKQFGSLVALSGIDLEINSGELVCFLGPSGCGKTTLLRAIAGLNVQSGGAVEQAGRDISVLPPSERDFGIVFQSYALFPNLSVSKNVAYGLENSGVSRDKIKARVAELLDMVGLPDYGDKYPGQLSGGQQQRVALARAIATSPGLLLLDEPLSALDAKVRVHLRHEIKQLQRHLGLTTIMVTHDQDEALTMADRIVVMNQGNIEQIGTPMEIYQHPRSPFVAGFIGAMNFLPGTVAGPDHIRVEEVEIACPRHGQPDGEAVTAAIRPERVVPCDKTVDDTAGKNLFDARIEWMEFLGSFYRAELECGSLGTISADFAISRVSDDALDVGSQVRVAIACEDLLIYPQAEGAAS